MANIDNECKDLEVKDFYDQSATHLEDIMSHQKEMQEKTYGIKFDEMSIREVMDFWHVNTHAVIDELHEMTDALGGCLLYTSPSPRDRQRSRMPSSA